VKALATIGVGPMRPVLDVALESFQPYAEKHGYDLIVGTGASDGRPPSWAKVLLLRCLLDSYDEILWLDSDMVVVDGAIDIASLVPADAFQAMVLFHEHDGGIMPNAGVWFLRSCPTAREFLGAVWAREDHEGDGLWENLAVMDLLGYTKTRPYDLIAPTKWSTGTHLLPDEWNQPMVDARSAPGARILHFCFMSNEKRVRLMRLANLQAARRDRAGVAPVIRDLEWALRRAELSAYVRRRGVTDRLRYVQTRFTKSEPDRA
jgi:hypothetical protein